MKKSLLNVLLLITLAITGLVPTHAANIVVPKKIITEPPYEDVTPDDWYYKFVRDVYQKNLMSGYSDTIFGAEDNLQRAQFATILWRIAGCPDAIYKAIYSDVPNNQYYTTAVMWASENNIVAGYTNNKFGTYDNITREQIATLMYRYANYIGRDTNKLKDISKFPDANLVSNYAQTALQWCVAEGIISGEGTTGELNPQGYTLRAVCATIISRFTKEEQNIPITPDEDDEPAHVHVWKDYYETVNHPAETRTETVVVKEAWTETVPVYETVYVTICNTCGADITGNSSSHMENHMLNGENGSCRTESKRVQVGTKEEYHPAVTEERVVVVREAYSEKVLVGKKCGCGTIIKN